jgi:pilus assembly protein Flp/PilA
MLKMVKNLFTDEKGQGMTEYGLVLGVVGVGAVVALVALRTQITTLLNNIKDKITESTTTITQ